MIDSKINSIMQLVDSIDTKGFYNINTLGTIYKIKQHLLWLKENAINKNEYEIVEVSDVPEKTLERQEQRTKTTNAGRKVRTNDQKMEEVSGGKPE